MFGAFANLTTMDFCFKIIEKNKGCEKNVYKFIKNHCKVWGHSFGCWNEDVKEKCPGNYCGNVDILHIFVRMVYAIIYFLDDVCHDLWNSLGVEKDVQNINTIH